MRAPIDHPRRFGPSGLFPPVALAALSALAFVALNGAAADWKIPGESSPSFAEEDGRRLYGAYCAPCHGELGQGDGRFYAPSLEPRPPDFTETSFVESRSDEDLFRAIQGGSASIGKSDLCPPWGKTFRKEEIKHLVAYIRRLQQRTEGAAKNDGAPEPDLRNARTQTKR